MSDTRSIIAELSERLHETIDNINQIVQSLSDDSYNREIDRLACERETAIHSLREKRVDALKQILAQRTREKEDTEKKRQIEREKIEEQRRKEWEDILAKRKRDDEEWMRAIEAEDQEIERSRNAEDVEREREREEEERILFEKCEDEIERVEQESQKRLEDGKITLKKLDEERKTINAQIEAVLSAPTALPNLNYRSRRPKTIHTSGYNSTKESDSLSNFITPKSASFNMNQAYPNIGLESREDSALSFTNKSNLKKNTEKNEGQETLTKSIASDKNKHERRFSTQIFQGSSGEHKELRLVTILQNEMTKGAFRRKESSATQRLVSQVNPVNISDVKSEPSIPENPSGVLSGNFESTSAISNQEFSALNCVNENSGVSELKSLDKLVCEDTENITSEYGTTAKSKNSDLSNQQNKLSNCMNDAIYSTLRTLESSCVVGEEEDFSYQLDYHKLNQISIPDQLPLLTNLDSSLQKSDSDNKQSQRFDMEYIESENFNIIHESPTIEDYRIMELESISDFTFTYPTKSSWRNNSNLSIYQESISNMELEVENESTDDIFEYYSETSDDTSFYDSTLVSEHSIIKEKAMEVESSALINRPQTTVVYTMGINTLITLEEPEITFYLPEALVFLIQQNKIEANDLASKMGFVQDLSHELDFMRNLSGVQPYFASSSRSTDSLTTTNLTQIIYPENYLYLDKLNCGQQYKIADYNMNLAKVETLSEDESQTDFESNDKISVSNGEETGKNMDFLNSILDSGEKAFRDEIEEVNSFGANSVIKSNKDGIFHKANLLGGFESSVQLAPFCNLPTTFLLEQQKSFQNNIYFSSVHLSFDKIIPWIKLSNLPESSGNLLTNSKLVDTTFFIQDFQKIESNKTSKSYLKNSIGLNIETKDLHICEICNQAPGSNIALPLINSRYKRTISRDLAALNGQLNSSNNPRSGPMSNAQPSTTLISVASAEEKTRLRSDLRISLRSEISVADSEAIKEITLKENLNGEMFEKDGLKNSPEIKEESFSTKIQIGEIEDGQTNITIPSANQVEISDDEISDCEMSNCYVSGGKIFNCGISDSQISDEEISDGEISDGDFSDDKICDHDTSNDDICDGEIFDGKISDADISDEEIFDGKISDADIYDGEISDGDFSDDKICDHDTSNDDIFDGEISEIEPMSFNGRNMTSSMPREVSIYDLSPQVRVLNYGEKLPVIDKEPGLKTTCSSPKYFRYLEDIPEDICEDIESSEPFEPESSESEYPSKLPSPKIDSTTEYTVIHSNQISASELDNLSNQSFVSNCNLNLLEPDYRCDNSEFITASIEDLSNYDSENDENSDESDSESKNHFSEEHFIEISHYIKSHDERKDIICETPNSVQYRTDLENISQVQNLRDIESEDLESKERVCNIHHAQILVTPSTGPGQNTKINSSIDSFYNQDEFVNQEQEFLSSVPKKSTFEQKERLSSSSNGKISDDNNSPQKIEDFQINSKEVVKDLSLEESYQCDKVQESDLSISSESKPAFKSFDEQFATANPESKNSSSHEISCERQISLLELQSSSIQSPDTESQSLKESVTNTMAEIKPCDSLSKYGTTSSWDSPASLIYQKMKGIQHDKSSYNSSASSSPSITVNRTRSLPNEILEESQPTLSATNPNFLKARALFEQQQQQQQLNQPNQRKQNSVRPLSGFFSLRGGFSKFNRQPSNLYMKNSRVSVISEDEQPENEASNPIVSSPKEVCTLKPAPTTSSLQQSLPKTTKRSYRKEQSRLSFFESLQRGVVTSPIQSPIQSPISPIPCS